MNQKNNKDDEDFSFVGIFGGCAVISGAVLFILRASFNSIADYFFAPIVSFFAIFFLFAVGYSVAHTLSPEMAKFPKWLRNICIFLLIIGLALAQYYLLSLIFEK